MVRNIIISIFLIFLFGCSSTVSKYSSTESEIYIGPVDEGLGWHPYVRITNEENSKLLPNFTPTPLPKEPKEISYTVQEVDGIKVGVNITMKCNDKMTWIEMFQNPESPLPKNYQVKMFIENISDKDVIINPSAYIIDDKGILKEPDINVYLSSLYMQADMEPVFVQIGPAPKKPTITYNSGTTKSGTISDAGGRLVGTYKETNNTSAGDALRNLSNVLKYQREVEEHRVQQAMARMKTAMVEDKKEMSIKYIQYILNNWLKYEYRIPPKTKVASVLYFQNTNNNTPITLNVRISDKLLQFESATIKPKWEVKIKKPNQDAGFIQFYPNTVKWSKHYNSLVITGFDKRLSEKGYIDIMYLKEIYYLDSSGNIKSWVFSGTLDERYQTFMNIDNYVDNEKKKGTYYRK